MIVALAAFAAAIIMEWTASTSVRAFGSHPDSSHTMCVPSAFNSFSLLDLGEIPPPDYVGWRLQCSHVPDLSANSCRRFSVRVRFAAMARWARPPIYRVPDAPGPLTLPGNQP